MDNNYLIKTRVEIYKGREEMHVRHPMVLNLSQVIPEDEFFTNPDAVKVLIEKQTSAISNELLSHITSGYFFFTYEEKPVEDSIEHFKNLDSSVFIYVHPVKQKDVWEVLSDNLSDMEMQKIIVNGNIYLKENQWYYSTK